MSNTINAEVRILNLEQERDLLQSNYATLSDNYDALHTKLDIQRQETERQVAINNALRDEVAKLAASQSISLESLVIQALGSSTVDNLVCNFIDQRVTKWLDDYDMQQEILDRVRERVESTVQEAVEMCFENFDCSSEAEDHVRSAIEDALENVEIRINGRRY